MAKKNRSRKEKIAKSKGSGNKNDSKTLTLTLRIKEKEIIETLDFLKKIFNEKTYARTIKKLICYQKTVLEVSEKLSEFSRSYILIDSEKFDEILEDLRGFG